MIALTWLMVGSLSLTVILGINLAINLWCFRRPGRAAAVWAASGGNGISILVPARNEAGRIGPCIRSLRALRGPVREILVLDDRSEDGTAEVVQEAAEGDTRVRVLEGQELPAVWTGKAWACHQLAQAAQGEWLLFTDADTRHAPDAVQAAVMVAEKERADLVSFWPEQELGSWGEKLVVPFMLVLLLVFLPHWMPGRRRSLGAANGQFLLFRRTAYQEIGGHEAVRAHLVDDVALARCLRETGHRVMNRNGAGRVYCRMYGSLPEVVEGFTKNLRAGFEGNGAAFFIFHVVEFFWGMWPFIILAVVAAGIHLDTLPWSLAGLQAVIVLVMRWAVARAGHQPLSSVLLHPIGQALVFFIAFQSWRAYARGAVTWRGRVYDGR